MAQDTLMTAEKADETNWPLLPSERFWTSWRLGVVLLVAACATWCFIIGEYVGYYLGFKPGLAAMAAGSMIGMLMVTLAVVPAATRYGIDSIVSCYPQFGTRGWLIAVFLQYVSIIGWNSLLLIFFGKSVTQLFIVLGWATADSASWLVPVSTIVSCLIVYVILLGGARAISKVSVPLFFCIVGVGGWMLFLLVTQESETIAAAEPAYASGSFRWDYVTGIEIGIVSLLSWWPYIGAMVRVAPNADKAAMPSMLGMGLPVPILSVIGLAAVLALGVSDPSAWMVELGGSVYGAIALVFVIAANLGTAMTGVYATSLGLKSVPGLSSRSWSTALLLSIVPVAFIGTFLPELFFANFGTFLAFIGVFFAPLCGIQIIDFLVLRNQRISVRALYDARPGSPYYYYAGFNPAALLAMAAGFVTYLYLLNPLSYVSRTPYEYLTASLPTAFVGAMVYLLVTLVLIRPAGLGGYGAAAEADRA
ncbi:MAG: cytosine permease [Pseudomonadota bacterium]